MNKEEYKLFVGTRIRDAREKLKLTREELAELCEIEPSFLAAIENGKKSMTLFYFKKICTALNVSADYIMGINTDKNNDISVLAKALSTMNEQDFKCAENIIAELVKHFNKKYYEKY
ncbi:MAG: helix-turn-helix transcriptional regulator [Firmicutes bacterium]|nr:helix-turn-helix transcriptional regulator [Bacillota bacterium]